MRWQKIPYTNHKGNVVFSDYTHSPPHHFHHLIISVEFSPFWHWRDWNTPPKQAPIMALNLCISPNCKWVSSPASLDSASSLRSSLGSCFGNINIASVSLSTSRSLSLRRSGSVSVRSSLETAGPTVTVGQVTEVNKDTFWPIVKAAGDKTVVLDMYTQWCGPCKVMAPKFQELSEKYLDVVFLKLDCNQENRPLAKELGIKAVPTFKILKDNKVVKEVTGAKYDDLVDAIDKVRSS
ncbi:hypothetical protein AAZX31_09G228200 [Glycine max]|uniref:Thioredoxin F-type, chloroplastic n=2 Tax=Glycine soja TaxID=3848 RepID=A0A445J5R1_GLYSO|nr:hypothetical protein JHK86_026251 [Glycine max]KAG5134937.1 hypothetical protein JHK82_026125 [Glycine max]KAH1044675.1 hypothetical protein GYH30_026103 [Glycine max]RZB93746.1 Thioredoxin F-type, chloroplastic [Glycine soja]